MVRSIVTLNTLCCGQLGDDDAYVEVKHLCVGLYLVVTAAQCCFFGRVELSG